MMLENTLSVFYICITNSPIRLKSYTSQLTSLLYGGIFISNINSEQIIQLK